MIKVNLLKNRAAAVDNATQLDFEIPVQLDAGPTSQSETMVKILAMLLPAVLLWGWETYNLSRLKDELAQVQATLSGLQSEITKNKPVVDRAKQMQREIIEIEERVALIKNLSKIRLREIKSIDYLQNVVPDKVWFNELEFKDGAFQAKGYSVSDEALNKFIEGLEGKSYFRNVILLKSVDQKTKSGTIKNFVFSSSLAATD